MEMITPNSENQTQTPPHLSIRKLLDKAKAAVVVLFSGTLAADFNLLRQAGQSRNSDHYAGHFTRKNTLKWPPALILFLVNAVGKDFHKDWLSPQLKVLETITRGDILPGSR